MVDAKELVERIKAGDEQALAAFFTDHTPRLRRLVEFRLNPRLRGRVDPDDVLQEAYLDAVKRRQHFTGTGETELFVWFRLIVQQTLADLHRRHLGAQQRDANREVALHRRGGSATTSVSLAANLIGQLTSPTQAVRRAEVSDRLEAALDRMDAIDREVLALRHFEELSNSEVARELGIQQKAASIRYVRALRRLKEIMTEIPEFQQDYQTGI
jgi:RNA polymerase sigma-70 factor (ECF subfamily)